MPDDESGKNIDQDTEKHIEKLKPIDPPMPPDNPYPNRAESVRNQGETDKIQPYENRMGYAEKLMFWIYVFIALFALASAIVGFFEWNTMQNQLTVMTDQLSVMEDQIQMTGRPWIKVLDVTTRGSRPPLALSFQHIGPFGGVSEQASFQLHVTAKNVGHSVATQINVSYDLFLPAWKGGRNDFMLSIFAEEKRFCNARLTVAFDSNSPGAVIFPDEQLDSYGEVGIGIRPENVNHLADSRGAGFIIPVVIGCINYKFGSSPTVYQTRFLYDVVHTDGGSRFFEVGRDISAEQIKLIREQEGDKAF